MGNEVKKKKTICTYKPKFMEKYRKIKNSGVDDATILKMTGARLGMFYLKHGVLNATLDAGTDKLDPIAVIAFCKAFDIPIVEDRDKEKLFERKTRFLECYEKVLKSGYTGSKIKEAVSERYEIADSTIENTTSNQTLNLNTLVVLAFCEIYHKDIHDIYLPETPAEKEHTAPATHTYPNAVDPELPNGFKGTFYGYFFNSTPDYTQQGILDQFTLDISSHEITMILRHYSPNTDTAYAPRYMRGRIIYNEDGKTPSGMLAIAFNSDDGKNFCVLAYNKIQLINPLYFRKGAMLIRGCSVERIPVIQSFIFTDRKIDLDIEENRRAIQGELALTNSTILIERDRLEDYLDSELLQKYFRIVPEQNALRKYIELDENIIRTLNIRAKDELYKILLQIKSDSICPRLFTFPSLSTDRVWRYIISLCEEKTLWQEGEFPREEQDTLHL